MKKELKRVVASIIIGASFFISGLVFAENIICVDLFEVFSKYKKTEDYDKVLEKKQNEKEKELEKQKEELDKLREELKLLKENERKAKQKELEAKANDFDSLRRETLLDLRKERDEKMKEILEDIEKAIERYAKSNKVSIVLKKGAVSYIDRKLDKTKEIIKILNKEYKK